MEKMLGATKAKTACDEVYFPKKEGGLGLKNLEVCNQTSTLQHVWSLFARSGSIWIAWVHEYLLKGMSFWSISVPHNSSWGCKKLLKLRGIAKHLLKFKVVDENSIHMWVDNWHPARVLLETYGYRVVYHAQSWLEARLSTLLINGD